MQAEHKFFVLTSHFTAPETFPFSPEHLSPHLFPTKCPCTLGLAVSEMLHSFLRHSLCLPRNLLNWFTGEHSVGHKCYTDLLTATEGANFSSFWIAGLYSTAGREADVSCCFYKSVLLRVQGTLFLGWIVYIPFILFLQSTNLYLFQY